MKEENVVFGLNLFRMGPARTILILGYFYPWIWLAGVIFMFSSIRSRRILGRTNLVKFLVSVKYYYW